MNDRQTTENQGAAEWCLPLLNSERQVRKAGILRECRFMPPKGIWTDGHSPIGWI
jgi:hypothetical protein